MWSNVLLGALLLSLAVGSPHGNRSDVSNLINGGGVEMMPFPPLVAFFSWINLRGSGKMMTHMCSGTLLTPTHVLTTASCLQNINRKVGFDFTIYAGLAYLGDRDLEGEVQKSGWRGIKYHPQYDQGKGLNDLAVIFLTTDIKFNWKIYAMPIYRDDSEIENIPDQKVSIYGFGDHAERVKAYRDQLLYRANTTIQNRDECQKVWEDTPVTAEMICTSRANGANTGQSDRGGPVIYFQETIGSSPQPRVVGIIGNASKHTRAASYCDWLHEETNGMFTCS